MQWTGAARRKAGCHQGRVAGGQCDMPGQVSLRPAVQKDFCHLALVIVGQPDLQRDLEKLWVIEQAHLPVRPAQGMRHEIEHIGRLRVMAQGFQVKVAQHAQDKSCKHPGPLRRAKLDDLLAGMLVAQRLLPAGRDGGHVFQLNRPSQAVGFGDKMPGPISLGEVLRTLFSAAAQSLSQGGVLENLTHFRDKPVGGEELAARGEIGEEAQLLLQHAVFERRDPVALPGLLNRRLA